MSTKGKKIVEKSPVFIGQTGGATSFNAITSDFSITDWDEHLSTILKTKSDELIKSSVENLVPTPSESKDLSKDLSDIESECNVPVCDDFTTFSNPLFDADDDFSSRDDESFSDNDVPKENFKNYSNPLFDEEIISSKIDPHHFNVESDFIESLLNRDILTVSYPKIDYLLEELSGELTHIILIPPGIKEADFDPEEEIRLIEELLYDNSSPRPLEESNFKISDATIESFSPSPIPVEDKLLNNYSFSLLESESFHINHYDVPSSPRPPTKPPDDGIFFDFEPDTGVLTAKVVEDISKHYVLMPKLLPTQPTLCPDIDTLLPFSSENEDKVFNPGILASHLLSHREFNPSKTISDFSESSMMIHRGDIPISDVPFLHLISSLTSSSIGDRVRLKTRLTKTSASWVATHAYPWIARIMKTLVLVVLSIIHSIFNPSHACIWESDILDLID
ncbi:hypothetical protein Tco_0784381 [Tanacetum coccineum]